MRRAPSVFLGIFALTALGWAVQAPSAPRALDPRLLPRAGSRLLAGGGFEAGWPLSRDRALADYPVLAAANSALLRLPERLAPKSLALDVALRTADGVRPVTELEFHAGAAALLVGSDAARLPTTVWLHELGHARMAGARPRGVLSGRLLSVVDEGAADYFAACLAGDPRLGDARELRDLEHPPAIATAPWQSLALPGFEPHRLGFALAAALYRAEPAAGPLLDALVACLDGPGPLADAEDSPAGSVRALLRGCPAGGRASIAGVLATWLPSELSPSEDLP